MEGRHTFLAFDCGATSCRAVLATFGQSGFSTEEIYRFPNGIIESGGRFYWDIGSIYRGFVTCLKELGTKGIKPDSIGIDTWGVDFGFVAPDGSIIGNPRAYRDPYTEGIPEEVFRILPRDELYRATGIQILNFNSVFQLYAQQKEGFEPLKEAQCILFIPDLFSYMLTGRMVCEYTDASTSGMMDQQNRTFNKALLDRIGVRSDILLPIIPPGTPVGTLKPSLAAETGLGEVPVIAVAGHDTASAIAAVPAENEQFAYLSSGTWSLMGIEVTSPIISEESSRLNFTNEGGIEGTTRFLKNITGMWLLEQCRKEWKEAGRDYSYTELMEMSRCAASFPGRIDPDDPAFANPPEMVKAICGRLRERHPGNAAPSDAEIVSCIYHSLTESYKRVLGQLGNFAPFPITQLHIIGGGSANALLNQWTANTLGIPVVAGPTEATAIGNIMVQAKAAGLVADRWEMRRMIAQTVDLKTFNPE
ncbi:MAG: rhamnulokinase [Bacteroidales bacterium]|nr:rhamnulokinase [Bacteroidales bacterium]